MDDTINFFDGFDGKTVGIVYGILIAFSILYQIWVCVYRDTKAKTELEELKNEVQYKMYQQGDLRYHGSMGTGESTPADGIQTKTTSYQGSVVRPKENPYNRMDE